MQKTSLSVTTAVKDAVLSLSFVLFVMGKIRCAHEKQMISSISKVMEETERKNKNKLIYILKRDTYMRCIEDISTKLLHVTACG